MKKMTGKIRTTKRGERSPPPLPMYERVVLKHVPTMVRRRYDSHLNIIHDDNDNQDLPSEDEKSDDDGVEDLDDSFDDNEGEDKSHSGLDTKLDSKVFEESFGGNVIESSTSSCLKDCEDDGDIGAKDLIRYVEASVGSELQLHEVEQVEDCKSRGEGTKDENVASYYMHVSVPGESKGHENFEDKQENCKSEGDGIKDDNSASYYADANVKDEVQDKEHGNSDEDKKDSTKGDQAPNPLPMYEPVQLKHVPTIVVRRYDKDVHIDIGPGLISEESKSEGVEYLSNATYIDGSVEDRMQVHGHAKSNVNDHQDVGLSLKNVEEKDDGAEDVNLVSYLDTAMNYEAKHNEQEICKSEGDGIKDDNSASYYVDANVKDEVQDKEHENSDEDKKVTFGKDSMKGDQVPNPLPMYEPVQLKHVPTIVVRRYDKDVHIVSGAGLISEESKSEGVEYSSNATYIDGSVEDRIQVHGHAKSDVNDQDVGLSLKNVEEKDDGAEDVNLASCLGTAMNYEAKHNEQDIITKDFLKTVERDGYDICCPNCKHYITQTLILRRREDCQHYQPTCFSFLASLFCCNRW